MINILVDKCKDQEYCLSDKEIQDWFSTQYIALRMNRVRFDATKRGEESFVYER